MVFRLPNGGKRKADAAAPACRHSGTKKVVRRELVPLPLTRLTSYILDNDSNGVGSAERGIALVEVIERPRIHFRSLFRGCTLVFATIGGGAVVGAVTGACSVLPSGWLIDPQLVSSAIGFAIFFALVGAVGGAMVGLLGGIGGLAALRLGSRLRPGQRLIAGGLGGAAAAAPLLALFFVEMLTLGPASGWAMVVVGFVGVAFGIPILALVTTDLAAPAATRASR